MVTAARCCGHCLTAVSTPSLRTPRTGLGNRPTRGSKHPTVKPLELMRYLVRLVTPPGGLVLDPFAGSGTTLEAAVLEGFSCIGVEREAEYIEDIYTRLGVTIETPAADTYVRDLT